MTPSTNLTDALPDTTLDNPAPAPIDVDAHRATDIPRVSFTSPQRIEANRRNAKKSTGPRTEEGKKASRLNASRHYLTGQVSILPDEERRAVEALCRPVIDSLNPVGESENQIARDIAEGHWRLARARATEDNLYADHIGTRADSPIAGDNEQIADALHIAAAFAQRAAVFNTLSLLEQRIQRALDRNYKLLATVQKERRALEEKALEEAKLLLQYARQHGEAYDPEGEAKANGGLVFPIAHLEALNLRDYRLRMARRSAPTWTPLAKAA